MDADELVRAIRAALDETERIATWAAEEVGDGHWRQRNLRIVTVRDRDREVADFAAGVHVVHNDPAAVLRRVAADREIVDAYEDSVTYLAAYPRTEDSDAPGLLVAVRALARGLGINPEEEAR